jgi:hypothetical protein
VGKWSNRSFSIETAAIEANGSITSAWMLSKHDRSVEMKPKQRNRFIMKEIQPAAPTVSEKVLLLT